LTREGDDRLNEISLVMQEKEAMMKVGQQLLELSKLEKVDELAFNKKALEFVKHLSNIGGFCDGNSKRVIHLVVTQLSAVIMDSSGLFAKTYVKFLVPFAIGIQVDYTKRPFRTFGMDVKAFGAQLKGIAKR